MSSEIKANVVTLAEKLEKGMTLGEGGNITVEKDLYEKTLPENLSLDMVKQVYGHTEDLIAAQTLATGRIGEEAMKKDKKLESVSSELPLDKFGKISVGYLRSQEQTIRNLQNPSEPPKKVIKYGVTSQRVTTFGQKNKGQVKKVREELAERGAKLFG